MAGRPHLHRYFGVPGVACVVHAHAARVADCGFIFRSEPGDHGRTRPPTRAGSVMSRGFAEARTARLPPGARPGGEHAIWLIQPRSERSGEPIVDKVTTAANSTLRASRRRLLRLTAPRLPHMVLLRMPLPPRVRHDAAGILPADQHRSRNTRSHNPDCSIAASREASRPGQWPHAAGAAALAASQRPRRARAPRTHTQSFKPPSSHSSCRPSAGRGRR